MSQQEEQKELQALSTKILEEIERIFKHPLCSGNIYDTLADLRDELACIKR